MTLEEHEEHAFEKRDRMNSEGHLQLELRVLFIAVGILVFVAIAYTCAKTLRNFSRATATQKRKEKLAETTETT